MKNLLRNKSFHLIIVLLTGFAFGWLIFRNGEGKSDLTENVSDEAIWTCSMHPQIRQNAPGQCPICGMDLIPIQQQLQGEAKSPFIHAMSPEAVALSNIQTAKVGFISSGQEINLTGRIAVNEQSLAVITADVSGRIERLFIDFTGQSVSRGQKIATIYSPELVNTQKELIEAAKTKEVNPVLYNAAKEKLRLFKITSKQIEAIETRGEVITEFNVVADRSGIVLTRNVSPGDYVSRGSVLFEIADLSAVWILIDAYETDLSLIKQGGKITFTVPSLPGREFTSTIKFIDPVVNPETRTLAVRAEAPNPGSILKPEMFVNAIIKSGIAMDKTALAVPKTSVLWTGPRSVIYVKVPNEDFPAFEMREITLGASAGNYYLVEAGLQEGEEVVVNGVFAVDAAAQLSGSYSMMNRPLVREINMPKEFKDQLSKIYSSYFNLKNSLVESDDIKTKKTADDFLKILNRLDEKLLDDELNTALLKQRQQLIKAANALKEEMDLAGQRRQFENISNAIIEIANTFGAVDQNLYVDYCPMAFDDKGAYWLSEIKDIRNPYFGEEMLRCGEVRKTISQRQVTSATNTPSPAQAPGHVH